MLLAMWLALGCDASLVIGVVMVRVVTGSEEDGQLATRERGNFTSV